MCGDSRGGSSLRSRRLGLWIVESVRELGFGECRCVFWFEVIRLGRAGILMLLSFGARTVEDAKRKSGGLRESSQVGHRLLVVLFAAIGKRIRRHRREIVHRKGVRLGKDMS